MSDETTDERPERMSDEERQQLWELKRKEDVDARADAADAAEEVAAELEAKREEYAERPLYHVLVRHMARSARTRTMRAGRAGHRRQGVILDDGTRIKKKGRRRYTQLDLTAFTQGHSRLLEFVRIGTLEVCDPRTEEALPYEVLLELVQGVGPYLTERAYDLVMRKYTAAMEVYEKAYAVWEEIGGTEPVKPDEPAKPEFELDERSQVPQDEVPGSESTFNTAPSDSNYEIGGDESQPPPPHSSVDTTRDDLGESAVIAAVDQAEAGMTGEANPPSDTADTELTVPKGTDSDTSEEGSEESEEAGEGEESVSEEELLKLSLDDLKKLAVKDFGVDKKFVKKLRSKKEVIALMDAASATEKEG